MKSTLLVLISGLIVLSGCSIFAKHSPDEVIETSEDKRAKIHEENMGKTEEQLVTDLGAPQRIDEVGGFRVLSYITERGTNYSYGFFANSTRAVKHYQQSRFYLKDNSVVKWDYESH